MLPKDEKELRSGERVLMAFAGAVLGCVATFVFAFRFYGMPMTTSGMDGVLGVLPISLLAGCVLGILVSYFVKKPGRNK